jgi:hypothetical protein
MSAYADDAVSGSSESGGEVIFELPTAERMLALVRRIVADIQEANRSLAGSLPELETLDRNRRHLPWPQRRRRYQLQEEVVQHEVRLEEALAELEVLGVALLDPLQTRLGFPTVVNNRRAFFVWSPGDEGLRHWQYAGESRLRVIPAKWTENAEMNTSSSRS